MRKLVLLCVLASSAAPAMAKDVEIQCSGCQAAFDSVAGDLVATIDYKAMGPAEATGLTGLGVGVVATYVPVDVDADWRTVTGADFSGLGLVGLQVTKGLPLDLDVGAFYTAAPGSNVKVYGGEFRYAILPGSTTTPAIALRGSYVTTSGINSFDLNSKALDVSLSKGFAFITPYVGAGYVWGVADPDPATGLNKAEVNDTKAFIGARISAGLFEITPEIGEVGSRVTYSLRLGFSI